MGKLSEFVVLLEKEDRNRESINIYWVPAWSHGSEHKVILFDSTVVLWHNAIIVMNWSLKKLDKLSEVGYSFPVSKFKLCLLFLVLQLYNLWPKLGHLRE